jgi:hypothetical protein
MKLSLKKMDSSEMVEEVERARILDSSRKDNTELEQNYIKYQAEDLDLVKRHLVQMVFFSDQDFLSKEMIFS